MVAASGFGLIISDWDLVAPVPQGVVGGKARAQEVLTRLAHGLKEAAAVVILVFTGCLQPVVWLCHSVLGVRSRSFLL